MIVPPSASAFFVFWGIVHDVLIPNSIIEYNGNCAEKFLDSRIAMGKCFEDKAGASFMVGATDLSHYQSTLKRCALRPQLDDCLEKTLTPNKDCFSSTQLQGIEAWKIIDKEISDFICRGNAIIAYNLFETNGKRCYDRGLNELMKKCLAQYDDPKPLYDINGIGKQCSQLDSLKDCFERNTPGVCPQSVIDDIVLPIMNITISHLCKNSQNK